MGWGGEGHWLWKLWKKHNRARDPWGYFLGSADQLLAFECIMANTRKDDVVVHVTDPLRNTVKPHLLGVILPDFTEWALPYVLVEDDGHVVGDWSGMQRVTHTTSLQPWEHRLLQHPARKPLFKKQKYDFKATVGMYRTIDLPLRQDTYSCLDSLGFLKGDFCTPILVYVASLVHEVDRCPGTLGVCAPVHVHVGDDV